MTKTSDHKDNLIIPIIDAYKSSKDPEILRQIATKLIVDYIGSNGAADTFIAILKSEVLYDLYLELGTELCVRSMCKYPEWLIEHYTAQAENDWNDMDLESIETNPESPFLDDRLAPPLPFSSDLEALYKLWTELVNLHFKDSDSFTIVTNQIGAILNKMLSEEIK